MTREDAMIEASGHFLTERLPENYESMTDDEFEEFVQVNKWEPLENMDVSTLIDSISSVATSIENAYNQGAKDNY